MPAIPVPSGQDPLFPLPGFNFHVAFTAPAKAPPGGTFKPTDQIPPEISGGFSEVTGLEATMEAKSIKVGGRNYGPIQRAGPVTFATVVLKRGIVEARHLWAWWSLFSGADGGEGTNGGWGAASRRDVTIALLQDRTPVIAWTLTNAMPVKFRTGDLNAKNAEIAIEELHLVHEGLTMMPTL